MRVIGTISKKDNLCDYCKLEFATCPKADYIRFGDGAEDNNVIECSEFLKDKLQDSFSLTEQYIYQ